MPRIDTVSDHRPLTDDWDNVERRIRNTGVAEVQDAEPEVPVAGLIWLDTDDLTTPTVALVTITSNTTLDETNHHVFCDTSSGPIVVTLPPAADHLGRPFVITNIGTGIVTVVPDGSETINGEPNWILGSDFPSMPVMSNGTEYRIAG